MSESAPSTEVMKSALQAYVDRINAGDVAGVQLHRLSEDSGVIVGALPLFDQELVSKGIPAESQADAQRILNELAARAEACQGLFPPAGCPGALE